MTKYVLVYRGGRALASAQDRELLMRAWRDWVDGLGTVVIDPGNPLGQAMAVAPDGSIAEGGPSALKGYMIFSADNLAAAAELVKGCPHRTILAGDIEVYETLPID